MPSMLSHPRRLQSGHFTCYLNRTYHVLTTGRNFAFDGIVEIAGYFLRRRIRKSKLTTPF